MKITIKKTEKTENGLEKEEEDDDKMMTSFALGAIK